MTSIWNPDIIPDPETVLRQDLASCNVAKGSALVGYYSGTTGAVCRTVQNRLKDRYSVKDFGAAGDGVTNDVAAFTAGGSFAAVCEVEVGAGAYVLNSAPTPSGVTVYVIKNGATISGAGNALPTSSYIIKNGPYLNTWVNTLGAGVFEYLEANSALNVRSKPTGGLGLFSAVRSSLGPNTAATAHIGYGAHAYHDLAAGVSAVWGYYGTVVRAAGVNGATIAMELDVTNLGATVPLYPNLVVFAGQSMGAWIASGGELAAAGTGLCKTASVGLCLLSNDPGSGGGTIFANFEKGIIIHSKAIAGRTSDAVGTGSAIAMSTRHLIEWYADALNARTGFIYGQATTAAKGAGIVFGDNLTQIINASDFLVNAAFETISTAANYPSLVPAVAAGSVRLKANGTDANIDVFVQTKGTGVLGVTYGSGAAATPANFVAARYLPFKDGNNILWYLPIATATW